MLENEVLRLGGKKRTKKQNRLKSLESHLATLTARKAAKASLISDVAAFDAIIAGIVSEPKRSEINASAVVVRMRVLYAQEIGRENAGVSGERSSISALNDKVQGDADHTATEKQEYADAKANEV